MSNRPRIYLDAAPLIDLAKERVGVQLPDNQRQRDVWYLSQFLKAAKDGKVELFTSIISVAECTHVEDPKKLEAAKPVFMGLLASGKSGIRLVQPTLAIAEKARDLRWISSVNLKGADAMHVASALRMGCDEFFTGDGKIMKGAAPLNQMGLLVCRPSHTKLLPAEYQQQELLLPDNLTH